MNGVGSSQSVGTREFASVMFDRSGEFHWLDRRPESLPVSLDLSQRAGVDAVVSSGGGQRGANFGVREAAGQRAVTAIPEGGRQVATFLVDDQFHQRTGVEVHQSHSWLPALIRDEVGY
jgi:hypothetical protein